MEDLAMFLAAVAVICFALGIGGLVADYVFPHIPPLRRWIDSLPEYEDDSEIYRREMERLRLRREARFRWVKKMLRR